MALKDMLLPQKKRQEESNIRKKFLPTLLITTMLLTGCTSAAPGSVDNSDNLNDLQDQVKELQEENASLKKQLDAVKEENTALKEQLGTDPEATPEGTAIPQQGTPISAGDTITTEYAEIVVNKVELTYDVLPDDTSGFYTHYAADPGNVYIHLDLDVKNLGKQNLKCDDILAAKADYNGGYTYSGFAVPEDSVTGFTYANITSIKPLETLGVHILFKCPQEVEESENALFITIEPKHSQDSYILTIR